MRKLLILDDSVALLEVMKNILERNGYVIKTISRATNVYEEIADFKPDLLILDIYIAGDDGRDICRQLKSNPETKGLCILVFSASPKTLHDYRDYCADGFIEKPFDIKILMDKISSVLNTCHKV